MKKTLLLALTMLTFTTSIFSQEEKAYTFKHNTLTINSTSSKIIKEIESLENITEAKEVILTEKASPEDFKLVCKKLSWITHLQIEIQTLTDISEIKKLTSLKKLKLRSIDASKETPIDLGPLQKIKTLESLDFYATKVSNTDALQKLSNLTVISFYMSGVSSLEFLSGTPKIEVLNLYGFKHTFENYEPVAKLKNLKELNIYMNKQATDENLAVLTQLSSLEIISMSNCKQITTFNFIKNCTNMKEINAMWCSKLTDFSAIKNFTKIEIIEVNSAMRLTEISFLSGKEYLTHLVISETNVTDISPLSSCKSLKYLDLEKTQVSDISPLGNCPNLNQLNLESTLVTDISALASCKKLSSLNIKKTKVTDISPLIPLELWKIKVGEDFPESEIEKFKKENTKTSIDN
ncbi:MAG: leucine-rich repeat domain-containing protein [Prolixibacteraceae bacterium]|jgi:internalin A|nr:leucine-rich repeat domain-containing protein [Prolixibacteraceae bacterium]